MIKKKDLINIATSFIGTKEGKNNWNIFAKELDSVNYYKPQKKQNVPYCSVFLDDMCYKLIGNVNKTHDFLYQPHNNDLSAGAKYQQNYFKKKKRYYRIPKIGDWGFIGNPAKHVCLVIGITPINIISIDGNHSNMVCKVVRKRSEFDGFGTPEYLDESEDVSMIPMKNIKKGDSCVEVLTMQTLLKAKGFKGKDNKVLALDSKFGSNTEHAVKEYQKKNKLVIDGVVGSKTWNKILNGG